MHVGAVHFEIADLTQPGVNAFDLSHPPLDAEKLVRDHVRARSAEADVAGVKILVALVGVPAGDVISQAVLEIERRPDRAGRNQVADQPDCRAHPERVACGDHGRIVARLPRDLAHGIEVQNKRHLGEDVRSALHGAFDRLLVEGGRR